MSIFVRAFIPISIHFTLCLLGIIAAGGAQAHLFSAGTFVPFFNKAQVNNSGSTRKFELTPYFGYGQQFQIRGPHYFTPEIGFAYFLETAKKTKKYNVFLHYNFSSALSSKFLLRYGLTTYWYTIKGEGGTVTLRNGSSYSQFPAPENSVTSYFTTVDLGGEWFFISSRSVRFDLNLMSAFNSQERALNYILTYNWYL